MSPVWWILSIVPLLAIITAGDALSHASSVVGSKLAIRKNPEALVLALLVILLALTLWLLNVLLTEQARFLFDLQQLVHVQNGHIVPYSHAELQAVIDKTSRQRIDQWSFPSANLTAVKVMANLEVLAIIVSLPIVAVMAKRQHRPLLIWLPLALLGNVGAIVSLALNARLPESESPTEGTR